MAKVFAVAPGMGTLLPSWYHFAIMFEAVFVLTVLDSGTRVIRFIIHEMMHDVVSIQAGRNLPNREIHHIKIPVWITSILGVAGWGLILSWGIIDKEGGTKALLKMFGIANQLLAVIALTLATMIMLRKHRKYVWVTGLPMLTVAVITLTAVFESIFHPDFRVGALAAMKDASIKLAAGKFTAAQASAAGHNAWVVAIITRAFIVVVISIFIISAGRGFSGPPARARGAATSRPKSGCGPTP